MMNNPALRNGLRFIGLVILQILVFKSVDIGRNGFSYLSILIYPIFILLLPIRTPSVLVVFLGFLIGITVDIFYDSPGVHAGASVFTAFIRSGVLNALEPRAGYEVNDSPTKASFGFTYFLSYSAILMFVHLLVYFSLEIFTPVYFDEIFLRTVFSFFISMFFIIIYQFLFNPKQ